MEHLICQHFFSFFSKKFLVLIIEQTVAITLEIGVCDLLPELFANALILLGTLQTAGAIATGTLQAFLDCFYDFRVFVQSDCHGNTSFLFYYSPFVKGGIAKSSAPKEALYIPLFFLS